MYGNGMENVVSRVLSRNLTYIRRQMLFRQIIMIITFVLIHAWNINSIGICWSLIMSLYLMKFHMRSHSDQTLSSNFRRFSTGSTLYICSNIHRFNKTGEQLCHFTHHCQCPIKINWSIKRYTQTLDFTQIKGSKRPLMIKLWSCVAVPQWHYVNY